MNAIEMRHRECCPNFRKEINVPGPSSADIAHAPIHAAVTARANPNPVLAPTPPTSGTGSIEYSPAISAGCNEITSQEKTAGELGAFTVVTLLALATAATAASDMTGYAKRARLHNARENGQGGGLGLLGDPHAERGKGESHNHAEQRDGTLDVVGKSQHNSARQLDDVLDDVEILPRDLDVLGSLIDDLAGLRRRACNTTACSCKYVPAGLFCGGGLLGCKKGYVYQCSGGPKSCEFGRRDSCQQCNELQC
ncbi:hypothetical protein CspHIS471_0301870 [Cutaneotrichosporon sp. HIS471]|nr:hypothetical protein CspHIS471_0301870 [Cutaneotrichosporon sp. HIS471]